MKWGVRSYQPYTGGKKGTFLNKKKKQYENAEVKKGTSAKKEKNNPTRNMTDEQLRQKINRLQMEKQYAQLTTGDKNIGQKAASMALNKIGNKVMDRVIDRTIIDPIDDFFKGK